ncbi:MAG: hypothetical protein AAFX94_03880 [Myxococcota bacterium]
MLPEDFEWLRFPDERLATCDDCYQVRLGEFTAGCQCCTYYPEIPNFMLGMALRDPMSREHVVELVNAGHGLPIGLVPTPSTMVRAVRAYSLDRFGQERDMVCPFMDPKTTHCRVYGHRNSVCSTFFCSHDHGDAGGEFWGKVQDLVGRVEGALAQWTLDQMSFDCSTYLDRLNHWAPRLAEVEHDGRWSAATREAIWGNWAGREVEFYEACADRVDGYDGSLFQAAADQAYREPTAYLRAVNEQVPAEHADAAPPVAGEDAQWPEVEDLWYALDLNHRRLWALPIGEGQVRLATGVQITPAPLPVLGLPAIVVSWAEETMNVTEAERDVLELFSTPRSVDERLFNTPQVQALPDPRGSLAEWLRRGVLVLS